MLCLDFSRSTSMIYKQILIKFKILCIQNNIFYIVYKEHIFCNKHTKSKV